jgi:hypothetical protein
VDAIVEEKVDRLKRSEQPRKATSARSLNVRPTTAAADVNRCADLFVELWVQRRRLINTPETPSSVALERFENEP